MQTLPQGDGLKRIELANGCTPLPEEYREEAVQNVDPSAIVGISVPISLRFAIAAAVMLRGAWQDGRI